MTKMLLVSCRMLVSYRMFQNRSVSPSVRFFPTNAQDAMCDTVDSTSIWAAFHLRPTLSVQKEG